MRAQPARTGARFIPAPAGNGGSRNQTNGSTSVHPRACGERGRRDGRAFSNSGSSPRLRGTAMRWCGWINWSRFIPAPAGNGVRGARPRSPSAVHPRACGERTGIEEGVHRGSGSSPRLRGTEVKDSGARTWIRFIPAPAGNGDEQGNRIYVSTVHPRACGERSVVIRFQNYRAGSSPRLRGTGTGRPLRRATNAVHPRACGERKPTLICRSVRRGSSPRLRGTGRQQSSN